jgi:hypothetical protein
MRSSCKYIVTPLVLMWPAACDVDRAGSTGVGEPAPRIAAAPNVVGLYAGTAQARVRTSFGRHLDVACPVRIDVASQTDDHFSGTVTIEQAQRCGSQSGTIDGTISVDGAISVMADAPGGGANVFEDAAARMECTLIQSSGTFTGAIAGGVFSARGDAVYDCDNVFGHFRAYVDVSVQAGRA